MSGLGRANTGSAARACEEGGGLTALLLAAALFLLFLRRASWSSITTSVPWWTARTAHFYASVGDAGTTARVAVSKCSGQIVLKNKIGAGLTAWNYFIRGMHPQQIKRGKHVRFLPSPWADPVPDSSSEELEEAPPSDAAPSEGVLEVPIGGIGAASEDLDPFAAEYEAADYMQTVNTAGFGSGIAVQEAGIRADPAGEGPASAPQTVNTAVSGSGIAVHVAGMRADPAGEGPASAPLLDVECSTSASAQLAAVVSQASSSAPSSGPGPAEQTAKHHAPTRAQALVLERGRKNSPRKRRPKKGHPRWHQLGPLEPA